MVSLSVCGSNNILSKFKEVIHIFVGIKHVFWLSTVFYQTHTLPDCTTFRV